MNEKLSVPGLSPYVPMTFIVRLITRHSLKISLGMLTADTQRKTG